MDINHQVKDPRKQNKLENLNHYINSAFEGFFEKPSTLPQTLPFTRTKATITEARQTSSNDKAFSFQYPKGYGICSSGSTSLSHHTSKAGGDFCEARWERGRVWEPGVEGGEGGNREAGEGLLEQDKDQRNKPYPHRALLTPFKPCKAVPACVSGLFLPQLH